MRCTGRPVDAAAVPHKKGGQDPPRQLQPLQPRVIVPVPSSATAPAVSGIDSTCVQNWTRRRDLFLMLRSSCVALATEETDSKPVVGTHLDPLRICVSDRYSHSETDLGQATSPVMSGDPGDPSCENSGGFGPVSPESHYETLCTTNCLPPGLANRDGLPLADALVVASRPDLVCGSSGDLGDRAGLSGGLSPAPAPPAPPPAPPLTWQAPPEGDDWGPQWAPLEGEAAPPPLLPPLSPNGPRPEPRFCGWLGPSRFMTAVERAAHSDRGRRELERLGRAAQRALGLDLERRARNDLDPPRSLRDALAAPMGRFADLLRQGLAEGARVGDAATKRLCRERLADPAVTALVPGATSTQAPREQGWKGLTASGRRSIRDAGAVLDDAYGTLAFVTATLTEDVAATATRDQIAAFQNRLLFLVRRVQARYKLPPLALLVCEVHPSRRALDGALVPHWHGVIRVAHNPFERWVLRKADWNRCVQQAWRMAFGRSRPHTQRLAMLPQKTGAARYLAKYMAKGCSAVESLQGTLQGRMIPKQWWTWTGELRALVRACRISPPSAFLAWCCRWWQELCDLGEVASSGPVQIGSDGAHVGRWFVWASEAAIDHAIERWAGEELARLEAIGRGTVTIPPARPAPLV